MLRNLLRLPYLSFALAALVSGLLAVTACQQVTPTPVSISSANEVPRISVEEAKQQFDAGTAVFLDTRGPGSFAQSHIPGALNLSATELESLPDELPTDRSQPIIAYCS